MATEKGVRWAVLLVLSIPLAALFQKAGLPAALLLGPMIAAIALSTTGTTLALPRLMVRTAQGALGCMIARRVPLSIFGEVLHNWPIFLGGVVSVVAVSAVIAWVLARQQILPGTTAVWGSSPGGAMAMVVLAESFGADARLVAFMQYLRVVCVTLIATLVARLWGVSTAHQPIDWFPAIYWPGFPATLALIAIGVLAAKRAASAAMLAPLAIGAALQGMGLVSIQLPQWLLACCYALIGWSIGLRFTRPVLAHAFKALPRVLAATFILIGACALLALALVRLTGLDPLTAYLATSPGGLDPVAIIAASSPVDMPFVMAMQMARLFLVLLTGPALARFIARHATPENPA